jgi:hypothetical protein
VSTFSELQAEVLSHQFSPSQYTNYIQDRLNQGQAYVAAQTDFRELFSSEEIATVNDDVAYDLPTDYMRVYSLMYTPSGADAFPLTEVSQGDLDAFPISSGVPTHYAVAGDEVRLWPTPDTAYTLRLRYYKKPASLVNASDTPEIPGTYHHLLVSYALWHCYERENDYNSAMYHKGRFDEDIMKCRGEVQYDSDDYTQSQRVGDRRTDPLAPSPWVL